MQYLKLRLLFIVFYVYEFYALLHNLYFFPHNRSVPTSTVTRPNVIITQSQQSFTSNYIENLLASYGCVFSILEIEPKLCCLTNFRWNFLKNRLTTKGKETQPLGTCNTENKVVRPSSVPQKHLGPQISNTVLKWVHFKKSCVIIALILYQHSFFKFNSQNRSVATSTVTCPSVIITQSRPSLTSKHVQELASQGKENEASLSQIPHAVPK